MNRFAIFTQKSGKEVVLDDAWQNIVATREFLNHLNFQKMDVLDDEERQILKELAARLSAVVRMVDNREELGLK